MDLWDFLGHFFCLFRTFMELSFLLGTMLWVFVVLSSFIFFCLYVLGAQECRAMGLSLVSFPFLCLDIMDILDIEH